MIVSSAALTESRRGKRYELGILPNALDHHLRVDDLAALDDHVVVEEHRAIEHRYVVVALGVPLAAALRVRSGREQEVARKDAGRPYEG